MKGNWLVRETLIEPEMVGVGVQHGRVTSSDGDDGSAYCKLIHEEGAWRYLQSPISHQIDNSPATKQEGIETLAAPFCCTYSAFSFFASFPAIYPARRDRRRLLDEGGASIGSNSPNESMLALVEGNSPQEPGVNGNLSETLDYSAIEDGPALKLASYIDDWS